MSDVKRYNANVFFPGNLSPLPREIVLADDAERLESEAQVLREEVAALQLELEGCQNVKERLAEIFRCADEPRWKWIVLHASQDAEELAALRARVVVPDVRFSPYVASDRAGNTWGEMADDEAGEWINVARLKGKALSEGLLRRVVNVESDDFMLAMNELRALLDGAPT